MCPCATLLMLETCPTTAPVLMYLHSGLFVDDDGTAYLAHTCRSCGTHIIVERLSEDYTYSLGATDPTARSDPVGPGSTEAPALFKVRRACDNLCFRATHIAPYL